MNNNLQPYIWILISGFAFSWMVVCTKLAGSAVNWQILALARCAIPFVLIALWAKWDGVKLVVFGPRILWIRSLAGSCSLVCTFYVLGTEMPITDIYTISNIFPIWVALLSWPMFGRLPTGSVWFSILCSVAGVALIQGAEINSGSYEALIVIAISLFTAVAMLGLNQLKDFDPRAVVVHFSGTALAVSVLCAFLFPWKEPGDEITGLTTAQLLAVGVTASIGQFFLTKAFTSGDPAKVSVASLSQFVFVFVLDLVVVKSPFNWHKLWGIPLILGPTIWLMTQRVKTSAIVAETSEPPNRPIATIEPAWAISDDSAVSTDSKS
jgi:drug/metabolite transporter (DMT)-like permease